MNALLYQHEKEVGNLYQLTGRLNNNWIGFFCRQNVMGLNIK